MATLSVPGPSALGSMLLALLAPACEPGTASEPSGPLAVEQASVDFGVVFEGRVLEHEWSLAVTQPVSVASAKTDCGCTLAQLERDGPGGRAPYELGSALGPGEQLRVSVRYDTRGRSGPSRRAVTLVPDAGTPLALHVAADVRSWLRLEPSELAFTRVVEGEGARRDFTVSAVGGEVFGLAASGLALPPWVTVELEPLAPGPDGRAARWQGSVQLGKKAPRGTFSYPLELVSDVVIPGGEKSETARRFSISPAWSLQVVGPVALSSPTLEFGLLQGNEVVARSVQLQSFDPAYAPTQVVARLVPLQPGDDFPLGRTATVRTSTSGHVCSIELGFDGLDPAVVGTFLARLVVETGHPALPRLEALVRGVRAPEASAGLQKP